MAEIISVRFRSEGKQYYFDPQGMVCRPGDGLIVETASGLEYAQCVRGNFTLAEAELAAPLRPVVRAATEEDRAEFAPYVREYCRLFGRDAEAMLAERYTVVTPDNKNPYQQMYVAN